MTPRDPATWFVVATAAVFALVGWAIAGDAGVERAPLTAVGFLLGAWYGVVEVDRMRNAHESTEEEDGREPRAG